MSHKCPKCGYGCRNFGEQHTHECKPIKYTDLKYASPLGDDGMTSTVTITWEQLDEIIYDSFDMVSAPDRVREVRAMLGGPPPKEED